MSASSSSTMMQLCQYDQGPALRIEEKQQSVVVSSWRLEETLQASLTTPTEIRTRIDPHLVEAGRPEVPLETVLGVWEEELGDVDLLVDVWQVVTSSTSSSTEEESSSCGDYCKGPHSEWKRQPLVGSNDINDNDNINHVVKWIDLRNASSQLSLITPASCCHFLRSFLGTSHGASPWASTEEEKLPGIVALVLPPSACETLADFRTGDACPSYFLHSVSQLSQVPWSVTRSDCATLLVYRTIPPREHLSVHHPLTSSTQVLPDGCLWERYNTHNGEQDDDENEQQHDPSTSQHDDNDDIDYRPVAPPYISHSDEYPGLLESLLEEHFSTIQQEARNIPKWTAWPERQHYKSTGENEDDETTSWTVFPLCHCFPAHVVENRKWIEVTCQHVPKTVELLREMLGDSLRTALFSRLDPETTLEAHTGWQDLANHVYRVHVPLEVPEGDLCGTWVDGCVETHSEARVVCFDDSKTHRAFNYSKQARVVLILDLERPPKLPIGTATGGHTEELDGFIAQLT